MKLTCYALAPDALPLRAAPSTRAWMDLLPNRHAYRCLPLTIANAYGWEIGAPCTLDVTWNGWPKATDVTVRACDGFPDLERFVVSHFAHGIATFHLTYLFRTEPGWDLVASGPLNRPKDGIAPLAGVIETDWLPYPFTMNWQMTRPGTVRFEKDEPICQIFPVPHGSLEFMQRYRAHDPSTLKEAWQRFYFLGKNPDGSEAEANHVSKLRLATPVDKRRSSVQA